jgi:peptidoglycan/xylan/chitin deacetylase (PgdA/CDA1 family)
VKAIAAENRSDDKAGSSMLASLIRGVAQIASGWRRQSRLVVLTYHRILPTHDPLLADEPDARQFEEQVAALAASFRILTLGEAVHAMRKNSLPPRTICLTFDDGYENNASIAAPILRKFGVSGTFFIATGYMDKGAMWNDIVIEALRRTKSSTIDLNYAGGGIVELGQSVESKKLAIQKTLETLKYLPQHARGEAASRLLANAGGEQGFAPMMSTKQVADLQATGMEIGAHTVTHPILTKIDTAQARNEIHASRERLIEVTRAPITSFAYPNGRPVRDFAREHVDLVRAAGFDAAVTTARGCGRAGDDYLQLPRVAPWERTANRFALRVASTFVLGRSATIL